MKRIRHNPPDSSSIKSSFLTIGTFVVTRRQRDSFAAGLWNVWSKKYPELFDPDDEALAKTQSKNGHHFYEWLAAILIFHGTGYLSLVEKYQFPKHQRKLRVVEKLASDGLNRAIELSNTKRITSQLPDLLVYAPDFSDWYFCEVKGGKDELGKRQLKDFELLASETGKSIRLINFELSNA